VVDKTGFGLRIFTDMFNPPDLQEELDKIKDKVKNMTQAEKSAYIREACARVEEARQTLLDSHKQNKPPMECIEAACGVLEQIGQPRTIN